MADPYPYPYDALGPEHPDVARSLNNLGVLYSVQGQYSKAEPLYQRALRIWEATLPPDHPNVAQTMESYAASMYLAIFVGLSSSLGPTPWPNTSTPTPTPIPTTAICAVF